MNQLERKILAFIADRSHKGSLRPSTSDIHREFGWPAGKHALYALQLSGHVRQLSPRKSHAIRHFEVTEAGRQALGRVAVYG